MQALNSARLAGALLTMVGFAATLSAQSTGPIKQVLLISIDGMHALDFANCAKGVGTSSPGVPSCPTLATLGESGVNYLQAYTSKPSDSFPGLTSIVTAASPRTAGVFYDLSYDRALSPPAKTTPGGVPGGANLCPGTRGTAVPYEEEIDFDFSRLDGGGGINPDYLPRDPNNKCAPVYPHSFLRVNTVFEVIKANGGYTAWSDKHPAYDLVNGPSGAGVTDLYNPEINSNVVALPNVPGCTTIPDTATDQSAWTNSFQNIQCYDQIKVQAVLNWIDGKSHDGSATIPVPTIMGMNFQAVSVGQKLTNSIAVGGYLDAQGTPSPSLLSEIQFVDTQIGKFVAELKKQGLFNSTLIIITAKHGQGPIDPAALLRIPADNKAMTSPASLLGNLVAENAEDDASLIWLNDQTQTASAVQMLQGKTASMLGGGQIYSGAALALQFNDPSLDSRTPDILITPNPGVVYTGGKKKLSEHGGFSNEDTNVIMLVANPALTGSIVTLPVRTTMVSTTILKALGMNPMALIGAQKELTPVLPGLPY